MCCTLPFGLVYFVGAGIVSSILGLIVNTYYTGKLVNIGSWKQMNDLMPIFINCCIMGTLCLAVQYPFDSNLTPLAVAVPTGIVYYMASSILAHSPEMSELIQIVKNRVK